LDSNIPDSDPYENQYTLPARHDKQRLPGCFFGRKNFFMKAMTIALLVLLFFNPDKILTEKWVIEKNSNLSIEGKSNVTAFRCDVTEYLRPDTVVFYKEDRYQPLFVIKGGLTININRFDCHQRYITADMRKTLKADESSCLKIDLLTIANFNTRSSSQIVKGSVAIELAGVTKKMEVDFSIQSDEKGYLRMCGARQVLFSDFGLVPPRKLAGLIKVEEEINVRFQLIMRPIETNTGNKFL